MLSVVKFVDGAAHVGGALQGVLLAMLLLSGEIDGCCFRVRDNLYRYLISGCTEIDVWLFSGLSVLFHWEQLWCRSPSQHLYCWRASIRQKRWWSNMITPVEMILRDLPQNRLTIMSSSIRAIIEKITILVHYWAHRRSAYFLMYDIFSSIFMREKHLI